MHVKESLVLAAAIALLPGSEAFGARGPGQLPRRGFDGVPHRRPSTRDPLTRRGVIALPQTPQAPPNATVGSGTSYEWGGAREARFAAQVQQVPSESVSPFELYLASLKAHPLATKAATSGTVAVFGDLLAQLLAHGPTTAIDLQRTVVFAAVAACYSAPLVHVWFKFLERSVGRRSAHGVSGMTLQKRLKTAARMVLVDQAVASPALNAGFLFIVSFLSALAAGGAGAGSAAGLGATAASAASGLPTFHVAAEIAAAKVGVSLLPTLLASWRIWPLFNLISFAFVPVHLRLLFGNFVGIGWSLVLSGQCH